MADVHVRGLSQAEHASLHRLAKAAGTNLNGFVLAALRAAISEPAFRSQRTVTASAGPHQSMAGRTIVVPAVNHQLAIARKKAAQREAARLVAAVQTLAQKVQALQDRVHPNGDTK